MYYYIMPIIIITYSLYYIQDATPNIEKVQQCMKEIK